MKYRYEDRRPLHCAWLRIMALVLLVVVAWFSETGSSMAAGRGYGGAARTVVELVAAASASVGQTTSHASAPVHERRSAIAHFVVATEAGGALKGAIPDAVPANLTEQLALTEARASGGTQIMANLADEPRLVAVYGQGEWVKMQSVLRGTDANTTVHWFKNLTTGLEVELKFK